VWKKFSREKKTGWSEQEDSMTVEQYREQLINYTLAFLSELEDGERVVREKLEATFDAFDNGPGRWIHVMPLE